MMSNKGKNAKKKGRKWETKAKEKTNLSKVKRYDTSILFLVHVNISMCAIINICVYMCIIIKRNYRVS